MLEVYPHPAIIETFGLEERLRYKKGSVGEKREGLRQLGFVKSLVGHLDRATLVSAAIDAAHTGRLILDAGWVKIGIEGVDLPEILVPGE